jgi:hypothetical protein
VGHAGDSRLGGFDPRLGRRGASLLGQEQAEFFCRSRAAGARGLYEPAMGLHHHVPATRLTKDYFRRWWYWKGVSKSRLERRHPITELGVDLREVSSVAGVPRFMIGSAVRDVVGWLGAAFSGNAIERTRREVRLCYFLGYLKGARAAAAEHGGRRAPASEESVPPSPLTPSLHL